MRFVQKLDEFGKPYVYLDRGNLEIPGHKKEDLDQLLSFKISTYTALKNKGPQAEIKWTMVFRPVHEFFDTLTDDEKIKYVSLIAYMHYLIITKLGNVEDIEEAKLKELEIELGQLLAAFGREVNLMPKIREFVETSIPIYLFDNVGERPQDTLKMTFFRDDIIQLTAVAVLCKLLTPISGVFIENCKSRIDSTYKDVHCATILSQILHEGAKELIDKFTYFTENVVRKALSKIKLAQVFEGYTLAMIALQSKSSIFTRKFILVDLYKPDGNLVTYTTMCIRSGATTQFSGNSSKHAVMEITPVYEQSTSEDGNLSSLESEIRTSNKAADFKLIVKSFVESLKARFPTEYELDLELIENTQAYYRINHVELTPANSYLMSILFPAYLDGANTVYLLDTNEISDLVAIMQVFFLKYNFPELVELVSAKSINTQKMVLTSTDTLIKNTWNASVEYRNCNNAFPLGVNNLRWDSILKEIISSYCDNVYAHNLAPALNVAMGTENRNTTPYQLPENSPRSICALIEMYILGQVV